MQRERYAHATRSLEQSKASCVGHWEAHEKYPYEDYLLEHYPADRSMGASLDFGCGVGRMILRMKRRGFSRVDGADLMKQNLDFAIEYLGEHDDTESETSLFVTDGLGCDITPAHEYDFIFSTICIQHICVHEIRFQIIKDLRRLLKSGGQMCLQLGFGWDNGSYWWDNHTRVQSTNSGADVSIPTEEHFPHITADMKEIGFKKVLFERKPSPHPDVSDYHTEWLFMHLLNEA